MCLIMTFIMKYGRLHSMTKSCPYCSWAKGEQGTQNLLCPALFSSLQLLPLLPPVSSLVLKWAHPCSGARVGFQDTCDTKSWFSLWKGTQFLSWAVSRQSGSCPGWHLLSWLKQVNGTLLLPYRPWLLKWLDLNVSLAVSLGSETVFGL